MEEELPTGKTLDIAYGGRCLRYLNQTCRQWTHPYNYQGGTETLSNAGCGIFSLCHAVEWMHGLHLSPEEMADFSMANGGRGDDGTDRPALLHALMVTGLGKQLGLQYHEDGLRNDLEALWAHMASSCGTALCNLRVGHIVAVVDARMQAGERQLLIIDSVAESAGEKVRDHVREVIPQSMTLRHTINAQGVYVGRSNQYGMFWVDANLPKDFNLLYKTEPTMKEV